MAITHKEYALIARSINTAIQQEEAKHKETIAGMKAVGEMMAATLSMHNDKFRVLEFLALAGISEPPLAGDSSDTVGGVISESNS